MGQARPEDRCGPAEAEGDPLILLGILLGVALMCAIGWMAGWHEGLDTGFAQGLSDAFDDTHCAKCGKALVVYCPNGCDERVR